MLEFHHILDVYDSVNEAVQKFESGTGPEAHFPSQPETEDQIAATPQTGGAIQPASPANQTSNVTLEQSSASDVKTKEKPLAMRSVEDKIKYIVTENPEYGAYKINKLLNTEKYAYTKVGWFGVRAILNQMGLSSRKSRKMFAIENSGNL